MTTDRQRKKFASEPNYHTTTYISEDLLIMEMKKVDVICLKTFEGISTAKIAMGNVYHK